MWEQTGSNLWHVQTFWQRSLAQGRDGVMRVPCCAKPGSGDARRAPAWQMARVNEQPPARETRRLYPGHCSRRVPLDAAHRGALRACHRRAEVQSCAGRTSILTTGTSMLKTKKIRLDVSDQDAATLEFMQGKCRGLYNWWVMRLSA